MRTAMQRRNPTAAAASQGNNDHQGGLVEEEIKPLAIPSAAASASSSANAGTGGSNGGGDGDGDSGVVASNYYSNAKPAFGSYIRRNMNKTVVVRAMLACAAASIVLSIVSKKSSAPKPRSRSYGDHGSQSSSTSTLSSSMSLTYTSMGDIGKTKSHVRRSFDLAYKQSFGFLDDIPNSSWTLMQNRVMQSDNHLYPENPLKEQWLPWRWYQDNWEPTFACQHERRIGGTGMGDGPKWVCNPHRIVEMAVERSKEEDKPKCLIYSIGSNGDFQFEEGLHQLLGTELCEAHVFDPKDFSKAVPADIAEFVHFHPWGIINHEDSSSSSNFKSLQEVVETLGHEGRTIDIFKIDCEGCEWNTFEDWFASGLDIRQILVEVHNVPDNVNDFFETLQDEGFVTFHKEPNTKYSGGMCQEYAFLKLHPDFFA